MPEKIILPRVNEAGEYHLSYSQIKLWNELKGYNTNRLGKEEYIRSYFFGEEYPDRGEFGLFGSDVEDYICERKGSVKFTEEERKKLETIIPLGLFQHEVKIPFEGFHIKGFIDDSLSNFKKIRDIKTASKASATKYYTDDYKQLEIYALAIHKEYGFIPECEVCVVERKGNGFRGGRDVMSVADEVWYIPRIVNEAKLQELEAYIIKTAQEISTVYQIFLKLNK